MMFYCSDIDRSGAGLEELLKRLMKSSQEQTSDKQTLTGIYIQYFLLYTKKKETRYLRGNEDLLAYFQRLAIDRASRTIAQLATRYGVTIENETGLSTETFIWNVMVLPEISSPFWFTVLSEDRLYFMRPVRTGTYRGSIGPSAMISKTELLKTGAVYEGETGGDYTIAADTSQITPALIDDTLKDMAVNKHLSQGNVITFVLSEECVPGDYVICETRFYIILSRYETEGGDLVYSAALEVDETRTYTGDDVTPVQCIDTSANAQSTAAGKWFGIGCAPSAPLDVLASGTAKAETVLLELSNGVIDADNDGTATAILWKFRDAIEAARIAVIMTNDWGSSPSWYSDMIFRVMSGSSLAERLRITSDGRLYGTALHNNSGSVTGATNQYIASGTYTPSLTNTTNIAASVAHACQWLRVGNVVTVSGMVEIDVTSVSSNTVLDMTLPIASAITNLQQLGGAAVSNNLGQGMGIYGDVSSDKARFQNAAGWTTATNINQFFTFTYVIL